ncbi:MAG: hypothetical protein ACRDE8_02035 [Ginsengibacter sp.]
MKKVTAIFLFFIMLLCSSGFYIAFYISLQSIKHTQQQIILSSELKNKFVFEFSFSKSELQSSNSDLSYEDEDEINYKGKMYDIASKQYIGDNLVIRCISDKDEDYTLALADNQNIKDQREKSSHELSSLKLRLGIYTFDDDINFLNSHNTIFTECFARFNPGKLASPHLNIPSPPPWL